jgi:hypothetical protein
MEFKEVTRKNGSVVVFCNFEDLLKEAYGVKTMEEVERQAIGDEYIIHCPFCKKEGHTKHKLYIKSDLTVGHCFVCTRAFINITDTVKPELVIPNSFTSWKTTVTSFELPVMKDPEWGLDRFKYEFDDFDEVGYKYLLGRHGFFKDLYKVLGFKFWNGNIVIPFMHNHEVYYYQIRFTGKSNSIRYYLPPVSKKSCYIIERDDDEKCRHRILIVEGVFDAAAALIQCPDYTPVAVLGSSISDYQIAQIRDYAGYVSEIRIWMDETKISKGIKDRIKTIIDYCPISIIKSYGPDPEEILQKRLREGLPIQWIKSKR